jgi:hypothetical protein
MQDMTGDAWLSTLSPEMDISQNFFITKTLVPGWYPKLAGQ